MERDRALSPWKRDCGPPTTPKSADRGHSIEYLRHVWPILSVLQGVLKLPGDVSWKGWEKNATGRFAVFSYAFAGSPAVTLTGCCFPDNREKARSNISISAGSRGEIVIDPASGAIIRMQIEMICEDSSRRSDRTCGGHGPGQDQR